VSLIFEALKKLEREKQVPERGFVVVAQRGWPSRHRTRWLAWIGVAALVVALVGLGFWSRFGPRLAPPEPTPARVPGQTPATLSTSRARDAAPSLLPTPSRLQRLEVIAPPPAVTAGQARSRSGPPATVAPGAGDAVPTPRPLVLQAISRRDGRPVAILSERLVHEGDSFDDVRVIRIGEDEVELEIHGERRTLRF
jgi:hypothetical protein